MLCRQLPVAPIGVLPADAHGERCATRSTSSCSCSGPIDRPSAQAGLRIGETKSGEDAKDHAADAVSNQAAQRDLAELAYAENDVAGCLEHCAGDEQDVFRRMLPVGVGDNPRRGGVTTAVLAGVTAQPLVEGRFAAIEPLAVVAARVERRRPA